MRGGLNGLVLHTITLGRCDSSLIIFKFYFVEDKVCEVFNGVLVNVFHEVLDVGLWDFKVGKFVNGVIVYSTSYADCDSYEGVCFPSLVSYVFN